MVSIVETLHTFLFICIEPSGFKILHGGIYIIIVIRIVLESVDLIGETIIQCLPEVDIRFMCIERSVRVGSIEEPVTAFFIRHDIDNPADRIRPESNGYDSFIDFDTFGKIDRNVIECKRISDTFLRYAVDKHLHMLPAETIQHQLHIRSDTTRFTQFHSRRFRQGIAQALGRILKLFRIYRNGIEGRAFQSADAVRYDNYFIQFFHLRLDSQVLFRTFTGCQADCFLYGRIANGRYHQCIVSCRCFKMIDTFFICRTSVVCPFQIDSRKINNFFFRR